MATEVVIVGSGIAGLVAAYTLLGRARERFRVTLLELEDEAGGQARAFKLQPKGRDGRELEGEAPFTVEHGSHVFFNYYKTIFRIIDELRSDPELGPSMPGLSRVPGWTIVDAYGHRATLQQDPSWLPAPYNVLPSILAIRWMPLLDRLRIAIGSLRLINTPYERFAELDQKTGREIGLEVGYTDQGLLAWNSASLGLTNLFVEEQSGAVFCAKHKVLIGTPDGLAYFLPAGDLSELIPRPLTRKVESLGATLQYGTEVIRLARPDGRNKTTVTYRQHHGEGVLEADHVILTAGPSAAAALLPWVRAAWTELERVSPVLTVVVRLDKHLAASVDHRELGLSREQWAFSVVTDLSSFWPEYAGSSKTVLRCEIGHADRLPSGPATSDAEVIRMIEQDLERLYAPEWSQRKVAIEAYAIHREEKRLYTKWVKGAWSKKPSARDVGQGVFLAGDWTTKGTIGMEAAANSGIEAANHVLTAAGLDPEPFRDIPL